VNLLLAIVFAIAAMNTPSQEGPFTCSVPILDPEAIQTTNGIEHWKHA
jgi:hypothetical protein